ncbi:hypothetical protein AB1L42_01555 [Thalassoglobus sp. JC818]|uniref:hypothetical protein n=1 Tax=Thalassoglobus sp. JC818 TaxID=3232136 RepID=UPI003459777B
MTEINSFGTAEEVIPTYDPMSSVSEADAQQFAQLVDEGTSLEDEITMQKQYEKNFQTISYLFMKGIYDHIEDEIGKQQ